MASSLSVAAAALLVDRLHTLRWATAFIIRRPIRALSREKALFALNHTSIFPRETAHSLFQCASPTSRITDAPEFCDSLLPIASCFTGPLARIFRYGLAKGPCPTYGHASVEVTFSGTFGRFERGLSTSDSMCLEAQRGYSIPSSRNAPGTTRHLNSISLYALRSRL
jgi:hypothetical protein